MLAVLVVRKPMPPMPTFAELLRSVFNELKDLSASAAARELTGRGIATARDGTWSATSVINVRERLKYQQKSQAEPRQLRVSVQK